MIKESLTIQTKYWQGNGMGMKNSLQIKMYTLLLFHDVGQVFLMVNVNMTTVTTVMVQLNCTNWFTIEYLSGTCKLVDSIIIHRAIV